VTLFFNQPSGGLSGLSINAMLLEKITPYIERDNRFYYLIDKQISQFMLNSLEFRKRQELAVRIIESIMSGHEKQLLLEYVVELARIEPRIRELEPWARDHVVHALLSYFLGVFLNENFLFRTGEKVSAFQWKIAGLFHDVGYPLQIASDSLVKPFVSKINAMKKELHSTQPDLTIGIVPSGLEKLNNGVNALDLIQGKLDEWELDINPHEVYADMTKTGFVDHGIVSALAVLYVIDLMYQEHNPRRVHRNIFTPGRSVNFNQKFFERDVVSACSAIFIHNLSCSKFLHKKIERSKAPVAFLLKMSDTLQEWERPSLNNLNGNSANLFSLSVEQKRLLFKSTLTKEKKESIQNELTVLVAPDIEVL
jgi:hypothetical protein